MYATEAVGIFDCVKKIWAAILKINNLTAQTLRTRTNSDGGCEKNKTKNFRTSIKTGGDLRPKSVGKAPTEGG